MRTTRTLAVNSCAVAASVIAVALIVAQSPAFAAEVERDVVKLFELGEKSTPSAVVAARSEYELLKQANANDARIDYAYGVVLLNQHRHHDALPLLSRYLQTDKAVPTTYCVRIWGLVQERRYSDALDEMVALSKRMPHNPDAQIAAECEQAARLLGIIFGYLELTRPEVVAKFKPYPKDAVLAALGDRHAPALDEGRNAVARRLAELKAKRSATQERAAAIAHEKSDQDKADLDKDRGKIDSQKQQMQANAEQLHETSRELNVLQTQLASLQNDRVQVGARMIVLQANISAVLALQAPPPLPAPPPITVRDPTPPIVITRSTYHLQADIATLRTRYATDYQVLLKDPYARAAASQEARDGPRRDYMASNAMTAYALGNSLTVLNKQAFDLDRRILGLQNRAAALMGKGQQEAQSLAQRDAVVQKAAKHAKAVEKKLTREEAAPPKASTAVLTSQMTSLSTYLPFPYEQEKNRVLGWFEKK
jgi:hypothetical protein